MKRIFGVLALVFGIAGVGACIVGAYGVWRLQVRIEKANDSAFDLVDKALTSVQARVPAVRERVQQAKITADDVGAVVKHWASAEARERVVTALEIEPRTAALSGHLQNADARLEASSEGLQSVRDLLELSGLFGEVTRGDAAGQAQDVIAHVRFKIQEAGALVEEVRSVAAGDGPVENRLAQIAKAVARIALTLSGVDQRLEEVSIRLSDIREDARVRREQRSRWIVMGAVAAWVILIWIGVAMLALARWGWR